MKIEDAYKAISISPEETACIKEYLNFKHTSINLLGCLTPDAYNNLTNAGWSLPQNETELRMCIYDFVNIYSAMYKNVNPNTTSLKNLVRGTSSARANNITSSLFQFVSTSTSEEVAKTFCTYSDAALIHFEVGTGVPFLNAEDFRSEDRADEGEVILAPFCKSVKHEYLSNYAGYKHYRVKIEKPNLETKSNEELSDLSEQVYAGFNQNIDDIKEYIRLKDMLEILDVRAKRTTDIEDQKYIANEKHSTFQKVVQLANKTNTYEKKLQSLLRGLCKQKELEIDKARSVIAEDLAKRTAEEQKRLADEEARKQEENRKSLIANFSSKVSTFSSDSNTLDNLVTNTYQDLVHVDSVFKRISRRLGINYSSDLSASNLKYSVKQIQDNLKQIKETVENKPVLENTTLSDVSNVSSELLPLFDAISSGIADTNDFSKIIDNYKLQTDELIKRNLYFKVHDVIRDAKIQKCLSERDAINKEPVSLLGRLTGKSSLKAERLRNVYLKLKLAQSDLPQEQDKYSCRQMLADLYSCAMTEFQGNFTPEMDKLYAAISETYGLNGKKGFPKEYIQKLAEPKIRQTQSTNLPTTTNKSFGFFGKTRAQIATLKTANSTLEEKLVTQKSRKSTWNYNYSKTNALAPLEKKLREIATKTTSKSKDIHKTPVMQEIAL